MKNAEAKKMNKVEEEQAEVLSELGRATVLAKRIVGDKPLTPFILMDVMTSLPDDDTDDKEFVDTTTKLLPKAHELAVQIFGPAADLEADIAVALRMPEDTDDEEEIEVFVEDFQFTVAALSENCDFIDVAASCMLRDLGEELDA